MTDVEFDRQYEKATSYGARILEELVSGEYFGNLSAEKLYEALCERVEEAINIEESEMKTILCEIAERLGRLEEADAALKAACLVLEQHRRFHRKVGCPDGADCYVCCGESVYALNKGREVEAAEERSAALSNACANLGAELAMATNALPERRIKGVIAAFRELEKLLQ